MQLSTGVTTPDQIGQCVCGWVGGWYALCVCGEVRQHSWPSPELLGTRTALLSHPGGACLMVHMYAFF